MSEGPPTPAAALASVSAAACVRTVLTRWLRAPEAATADDWTLWRRACGGDAFAATALVQQLTPQALGLARQLLRNGEDAEDMVQESFLRLWQARPSDTQGARLATYFNTIVINRCKSLLTRRRELAVETETLVELAEAQASTAEGRDEHGPAPAQALAEALLRLPPRQRMALAMWAYADAGAAEIAAALDLDANAAHQLLHRAKQSLRRQWQGG
jgi:RNA polymerase sigma-70 factor (ECF subfamily)